MSVIPLTDGRDLEYELAGPEGPVVLFHHGMPGSAVHMPSVLDPLVERGFRVVTYSRPGYGNSTPSPGRTVADSARDCAQLLEKLGVDRYFSFGWSGGGPHGLASAAVDGGRAAGVVVSASFAPFDARGLDFVDGMGVQNHVQFGSVGRGEQAMRDVVEQMAEAVRGRRPDEVTSDLGSLFPEVDLVAMATGFGAENAANMDHALRSGSDGWLADLTALSNPWGFDLDAVDVPVELWHGRLDKMVPVAHGEWLAGHVRRVVAHIEDGHGHISQTVGNVGRMLDALAARVRTPTSFGGAKEHVAGVRLVAADAGSSLTAEAAARSLPLLVGQLVPAHDNPRSNQVRRTGFEDALAEFRGELPRRG